MQIPGPNTSSFRYTPTFLLELLTFAGNKCYHQNLSYKHEKQERIKKTFHQLRQGSTETPRRNDPNVTTEQHFSAQASALLWAHYCLQRQPVLIKNKTGHTLNPRFLQAILFFTHLCTKPSILSQWSIVGVLWVVLCWLEA